MTYKNRDEAIAAMRSLTPEQRIQAQNKLSASVFHSPDGCWYWIAGLDRQRERGRFCLVSYIWYAHRAAYELWIGPIPEGLDACHHCDNKLCVNPYHIFLGTDFDNQQDFYRKGRIKKTTKGERNPKARLNNEQILMIRELRGYLSQKAIALRFDVSVSLVSMIQNRKLWTHI